MFVVISSDVYKLTKDQKYEVLGKLVSGNPSLLNNLRDGYNRTLLMGACWFGHDNIVTHLSDTYKHIIDVGAIDTRGENAYHYAAQWNNNISVLKKLFSIDGGSGVNKKDRNGWTPLHWAALKSYISNVEWLIDAEADVDIVDDRGRTPDQIVETASLDVKEKIQQHRMKM